MYWINNNTTPFLDALFSFITILGEAGALIIIIGYYYWCKDKEKGIILSFTLFLSLLTMGITKAIVKQPRPFKLLDVQGVRQSTATGYSFPSGHSTGASTVYTSVAVFEKKTIVTVITTTIFILVAISRVWLRVHWPLDVFIGTSIGLIFALWISQLLIKVVKDPIYFKKFINISIIISLIATVGLTIAILLGYDYIALGDLVKNSAVILGSSIGILFEKKYINFKVAKNTRNKIITLSIGLIGCILIMSLKVIIGNQIIVTLIRYIGIGLWVTCLLPMLGKKIKVFE